MQVRSLGWEYPLEEGMATHPSILASEIPWTEDLGRLYSPQGCKESETSEAASTHAQIYITQTSSLVLRTLH